MFRFIRALVATRYWMKALKKARSEDYQRALHFLNKMINITKKENEEVSLLKGFLLCAIGNDVAGIKKMKYSIELINNSNKLNIDEKNYLTLYARDIVAICDEEQADRDPVFKSDNYNLNNVAEHLITDFPVVVKDSTVNGAPTGYGA